MRFKNKDSLVSAFQWSGKAFTDFAYQVHPALAQLSKRMPRRVVADCLDSCASAVGRRIAKYPIQLVAKDGEIVSVAGRRSLQVKPSQILQSLVSGKIQDILVEYDNHNLTVTFMQRGLDEIQVVAVRTLLSRGWALERAWGYMQDNRPILGKFSRWVVADWPSAFFNIRGERNNQHAQRRYRIPASIRASEF
jgi:hypothetical protein